MDSLISVEKRTCSMGQGCFEDKLLRMPGVEEILAVRRPVRGGEDTGTIGAMS